MSNHEPLRDALRDHADRLGDTSPLTQDDVKGRAKGIRRRRLAVSGLAAAAVLAVAVPAGITVSRGIGGRPDSGPAASPSVTPTKDASETPEPSPAPEGPAHVTLTTEVEAGSYEPGIPYLYDGAIVRPDGSEVPVDADYTAVAALGDGWVASRTDENGYAFVDLLDTDGTVTASKPSTGSLAVSQDGTVVAYATPDGELMTVVPDSAPLQLVDPEALPGGLLQPVAVIGSDSCLENSSGGGCAVFLNSQGEQRAAYSATAHGIVGELPGLLTVAGLSPDGSLSGLVSASDGGSCSQVLGRDWEKAWQTCDYTLGQFSPDGRYVIGRPAYLDGSGDSSVGILDARSGELLAEYTNSEEHPAIINNVVWDEDGTLLATVYENDAWSLMRMTADGQLTSVSNLIDGPMEDAPLRFSTRP